MRFLRFLIPACLLLIGAGAALADGTTDPRMTMGGSGSCADENESSASQSFTGLPVQNPACLVDFTNNINNDTFNIFTLVATVTSAFQGSLSCAESDTSPLDVVFLSSPDSCTFTSSSDPNIVPGSTYSLSFDNLGNAGFGDSVDIRLDAYSTATTPPMPEPSTTLLACIGLAGLLVGMKMLKVAGIA
jgi:hypothetical protein